MLGFAALGEAALGEGGDLRSTFITAGFSQPMRRATLTIAVVATTFAGFVPPPAPAAPVFTKFSEPLRKAVAQPGWQSAPFAAAPVVPVFLSFSQPQPARRTLPVEQPVALFEITPTEVPFSGFMDFGVPQFVRYSFVDQQAFTFFEIRLPEVVPGGGGDEIRPPQRKKRRVIPPPAKVEIVERALPIPPFVERRVADVPPIEPVDPALIPTDLLALQASIHAAEDEADVERFLAALDQDEQDAADIADVLSILDDRNQRET